MASSIRFYADSWDDNDILYGWDFDMDSGEYFRAIPKRHCAPFPKPMCLCGSSQQNVRPLYVSNLSWDVDVYLLRAMFEPFGTVSWVHVKYDWDGNCRGFGFVWYSTDKEASYAIRWMNGRFINGEALYVALAEYREDRRARLAAYYDNDYYNDDDVSYSDSPATICRNWPTYWYCPPPVQTTPAPTGTRNKTTIAAPQPKATAVAPPTATASGTMPQQNVATVFTLWTPVSLGAIPKRKKASNLPAAASAAA